MTFRERLCFKFPSSFFTHRSGFLLLGIIIAQKRYLDCFTRFQSWTARGDHDQGRRLSSLVLTVYRVQLIKQFLRRAFATVEKKIGRAGNQFTYILNSLPAIFFIYNPSPLRKKNPTAPLFMLSRLSSEETRLDSRILVE